MGVRVAYGKRENILPAIESGTIPKDCLIITKNTKESEMFFYDRNGQLSVIAERTRFDNLDEAKEWVQKYLCKGYVIVVKGDTGWYPYIVQEDGSLSLVGSDGETVTRIDGGSSADIEIS